MKAMVLAAGFGTRLRPATERIPKPLFPVAGTPAIEWAIRALKTAGAFDVVVNLHHLPQAIVAALQDGSQLGVRVHYSEEEVILGTGGGIARARPLLDGADFFLHNGDIFTDFDLPALLKAHSDSGASATLALADATDRPDARVVEVGPDGFVVGIRGKPRDQGGPRYVYAGIAVLSPAIFSFLPRAGPSCLVENGLIPMLRAGLRLRAEVFRGLFCDIGTPERYLALQWEVWARREVLFKARGIPVPSGAIVDPSARLIQPLILCQGATIEAEATVGPRVVLCSGARVKKASRVHDAVLFPMAQVEGEVTGMCTP